MKIHNTTGALGQGALGLFITGAITLMVGCQSPPAVREYQVEKRTDCGPCAKRCVTQTHITEIQSNSAGWPVLARPHLDVPKACPPPLNPPIGSVETTTDQNYPDGIHHLAGGPLYYESQNANWEQAPPFGTW